MKLKGRHLTRGREGYAVLIPEHGEDLWHVYNLIREGDNVSSVTQRKVTRNARGDSEIVKLKLLVKVENVDFDSEGDEIRLKGRNLTESEHIRLGAYHTLSIIPNREFKLIKEVWDSIDIDRVFQSCDVASSADLAVLLITDGYAQLTLVGSYSTLSKGSIETHLPRKGGAESAGYEKTWNTFMEKVYACVEKYVNFEIVRCLVIAGPGFAKDTFKRYLSETSVQRGHKQISDHRSRFLTVPASTAYKHGLKEVLQNPSVMNQIQNTKAIKEIKVLEDFHIMLATDSARAFYGTGHVFAAADVGAVETLLISDALFRNSDFRRRTRYVQLVEDIRKAGGTVHIFSTAHVSGDQLNRLSGIAALLRFPLPDVEDQEFNENDLFG